MTAFPASERFPVFHLLIMNLRKNVHLEAIEDNGAFVGLALIVEGAEVVYLAYLAINPDKRSQGYGSKVLQQLKKRFADKQIVLDIEPVTKKAANYSQRVKRLKFYQQNGFTETKKKLIDEHGQFSICTNGDRLKEKDLRQILNDMGFGLYKFKIE